MPQSICTFNAVGIRWTCDIVGRNKTWEQAQSYCGTLSESGFNLPTVAEFEALVRAGQANHWGEDEMFWSTGQYLNFAGNYAGIAFAKTSDLLGLGTGYGTFEMTYQPKSFDLSVVCVKR